MRLNISWSRRVNAALSAKERDMSPEARRRRFAQRRVEGIVLIHEIVAAGECITAARDWDGELVRPMDGQWRLLRTIERSTYCLSISDLARVLCVSRQAAHRLAVHAACAGLVELLPNPDDARILQIRLTVAGRSRLAAAHEQEAAWVTTLLNGLGTREIQATAHILSVIRRRLLRDERERARNRRREQSGRPGL